MKKCYFENYRFSEDIDTTIVNPEFELKRKHIQQVCDQVTEISGIAFRILSFKPVRFNDRPVGWDVEVCFWGANHERNRLPVFGKHCHIKIGCEFRFNEQVLFDQNTRRIFHFYSDVELIQSSIPCYDVHEKLAEKLRALIQRNRGEARDYFDIWYIMENIDHINWQDVKNAFLKKCAHKNVSFTNSDDFFQPRRIKQV
ncbi:MAG: nucleotidyl transferase AbiEii/AbiGii toxin family protein [Saprospirales bacterium]|nr:MAG: nucleotidyl transferase AbiEii/AbiGii toxin family protein [Saprospirales bacterium]